MNEDRDACAEPAACTGRARILVIEDDPYLRQIIQGTLEEEGFIVEMAADGWEGVERASRRRPSLILLDLYLPSLDGAAVADELRAHHGKLPPIVLITADDRPAAQAQRVGAVAYLRKPFELDALVSLVRRGLDAQPG